jgi:hypothetical protein
MARLGPSALKATFLSVEKPSPAMLRALRQAHQSPVCAGSRKSAVCRLDFAARMVSGGWLAADGKDYRLTEAGKLVIARHRADLM